MAFNPDEIPPNSAALAADEKAVVTVKGLPSSPDEPAQMSAMGAFFVGLKLCPAFLLTMY
jgi:hypothetical protein